MVKDITSSHNNQQSEEINLNPFSGIHHSFDVKVAEIYGIQEAIIIHHLLYWIKYNHKLKRNFIEGRTWTYQTLDEIAAHFPYLTKTQVFDILEKLRIGKNRRSKSIDLNFPPIIMKGNFNKTKYDHTIWYAFIDEEKWQIPKSILESDKNDVGKCQNRECEMPIPIPNTIPDSKNIKETNLKVSKEKPQEEWILFGEKVKLTQASYDELAIKFTKEKLDGAIEEMNDYLVSLGKNYKDYAAAIRNWIRREEKKKINSLSSTRLPSQIDINRKFVQELKLENPGVFDHMHDYGKIIKNKKNGNDLGLDIDPEMFAEAFIKLSGARLKHE